MDTLFISANFFGYASEIKTALEATGRSVLWFEDRPATDVMSKALIRFSPKLMESKSHDYFRRIAEQARQHPIRDVLVIKGEALSLASIRMLREALPEARFTLYFWDSYANMPKESPQKVDLFDKAFSFDPEDVARDTRLTYRSLFFINDYSAIPTVEQDIDILFVGTAHSDRVAVVDRITKALPPGVNFKKLLYCRSQIAHRANRICIGSYRNTPEADFIFKPISKAEIQALVARSKAVLDLERTIQSGFTMRTIEMLGASKKTITTNPQIRTADFYSPDNQLYIDRNAPVIPVSFLDTPWAQVDPTLLDRYSLTGWVKDVLGR